MARARFTPSFPGINAFLSRCGEKKFARSFQDDETYETQSRISFVASRYENDELITCEANNPVLEDNQEEPQRAEVKLDIHCEY